MKLLGTIYVGSYETTCSVYELKRGKRPKRIDEMRLPVPIVHDITRNGRVSMETTERLTSALSEMKQTMDGLGTDQILIYCGATLHMADNELFVLSQIRMCTGLVPKVLRNSEQRFFEYEAAAAVPGFEDWVRGTACMADIGGASLQLTIFSNGTIETTQHLQLGTFHVRENLIKLEKLPDATEQLSDVIDKEFDIFQKMYLGDRKVDTIIILEDQLVLPLERMRNSTGNVDRTRSDVLERIDRAVTRRDSAMDASFVTETFEDSMIRSVLLLHRQLLKTIRGERVLIPSVTINDGIACHFANEFRLGGNQHDFRADVISAARRISKRYGSYQPHLDALVKSALQIFDAMKKYHGMGVRERIMTEVACILHDCGKYISIARAPECSCQIILSSEILGLTHKEREMVASIVQYNREKIPPYSDLKEHFTEEEYWTIVRILAILRVANALDRSHKQKLKDVSVHVRKKELVILVRAEDPVELEKGMFDEKADFFENVYAIRPVIRERS